MSGIVALVDYPGQRRGPADNHAGRQARRGWLRNISTFYLDHSLRRRGCNVEHRSAKHTARSAPQHVIVQLFAPTATAFLIAWGLINTFFTEHQPDDRSQLRLMLWYVRRHAIIARDASLSHANDHLHDPTVDRTKLDMLHRAAATQPTRVRVWSEEDKR